MISESVLLVPGGMTSLERRPESGSSQDVSQDSIFGSKEETRTRKIRTLDTAAAAAGGPKTAPCFGYLSYLRPD